MSKPIIVQSVKQRFYANAPSPQNSFNQTVLRFSKGASHILDMGCGRTAITLGQLQMPETTKVGIDLVDEFEPPCGVHLLRADGAELPFEDETFHVVCSRSVLEHLVHPEIVFREVRRVLKPNGRFVFLTPNRWDYVSLGASMIPNELHPWLVRKMTGRDEKDTFPTVYRANTERRVRSLARESGLTVESVELLREHPHYFIFNSLLYVLGTIYEQTIQRSVRILRPWILGVLQRPLLIA